MPFSKMAQPPSNDGLDKASSRNQDQVPASQSLLTQKLGEQQRLKSTVESKAHMYHTVSSGFRR